MRVAIRVIPNAPRTVVEGIREGEVVIRINAPARDGRANRALLRYLARRLKVAPGGVRLLGGEKSRHKKIEILGLEADADRFVGLLSGDG